MAIVKIIAHPDGTRKVHVFRRADGTFGFEELRWQAEEGCWCPDGRYSTAIVDTLERVLLEVKGRVDWVEDGFLSRSTESTGTKNKQ